MSGNLLSGAANLIGSVASLFGTTQNSSGTSSGKASSQSVATSSTTAVESGQTINSADPAVIAMGKLLAQTALNNAANPGAATSDIVSGLFQSAKDSFASIFGQQGQSGLYNSSTEGVEQNAAYARATADAASAVLGYQTQEQGIAQGEIANLLTATATQSTNETQTNNTTQTQNTKQQQNSQNQETTTKSDGSVVCTWMRCNGYLDSRRYCIVTRHFQRTYSIYGVAAYQFWGRLFVAELERDQTSKWSNFILTLFTCRTEYVCACEGYSLAKKEFQGWLAKKIVYAFCFPVGISLFVAVMFAKMLAPRNLKVSV